MAEIDEYTRSRTFHLSLITPERAVLSADVSFVALPAHDGEIGIMPRRAPLLVRLGAGWMRIHAPGKAEQAYLLDGGFAQMVDNKLSVLTEHAQAASEVDAAAAKKELAEALARPIPDEAAYQTRQRAIARARAELRGAAMDDVPTRA